MIFVQDVAWFCTQSINEIALEASIMLSMLWSYRLPAKAKPASNMKEVIAKKWLYF